MVKWVGGSILVESQDDITSRAAGRVHVFSHPSIQPRLMFSRAHRHVLPKTYRLLGRGPKQRTAPHSWQYNITSSLDVYCLYVFLPLASYVRSCENISEGVSCSAMYGHITSRVTRRLWHVTSRVTCRLCTVWARNITCNVPAV